jgi:beta-barrel assembly-enhancing protease
MKRNFLTRPMAIALAVCFMVAEMVAVAGAPELPDPGTTAISREQQQQLGLQAMAEVYKQMPVLPDNSPETKYIQALGKKLANTIPSQVSWPWQFHVIQQKEINAFALPGGPMFVNLGTITAADNEAQLAGVMAHEMSHVYMQHSAKQAQKGSLIQGLAGLAGAVLGNGAVGSLARAGIGIGAGTIMLKYSREDESQADAVGAIILWKAGYNPIAMAQFFQKLASEGGSRGPQFLSDHPNPGNRDANIRKQIAGWPPKSYQGTSSSFQSTKQHAASVKAYTAEQIQAGAKSGQWESANRQNKSMPANMPVAPSSQQQGSNNNGGGQVVNASLPNVSPSGNFKDFNSDVVQLKYPDNWQVISDQQGQGLTIAPQAGVSQEGGIAYGVVIGGVTPQGQNASLDQATKELLSSMEQNQGVRAVGSPENIRVNGVAGKSVDLTGNSPIADQNGQPAKERDWLVTVQRSDGSLLYLVFVSPERDFSKLRPTYETMLKSLRVR